jgi:hypothetical protein
VSRIRGTQRVQEDTTLGRFGTVRPRVQIPGPRPISEYDSSMIAGLGRAPDHSRITISQEVHEPTAFSRRTYVTTR